MRGAGTIEEELRGAWRWRRERMRRGEGVTVLGREGLERGLLPLFAFYVSIRSEFLLYH